MAGPAGCHLTGLHDAVTGRGELPTAPAEESGGTVQMWQWIGDEPAVTFSH
ncbi:hypothetical protein [Dactylosporangium sp. NPDC005555]|uniref:hypothetical protein n=1 Tax=Dactylosporangium sp. NPDC005555 TaxID=3154889 RepID=UPI0033AA45DE